MDYVAHIRDEVARFRSAVVAAEPGAAVPTCPEWDADDLLWHLGGVLYFWHAVISTRASSPTGLADPDRPADRDGLLALLDDALADLLAALAETPDEVAVWTWSDDHRVGFIRRRMAHEALIHRLDAEVTTGALTGVDAALAADGVAELLEHFYGIPEWAAGRIDGPTGLLRAVDTGDSWLVQLATASGVSPDSGEQYTDEPALAVLTEGSPDFTVSAPARDLDAWLWHRPTIADVAVDGDRTAFDELAALVAVGID